MHAARPVGSEAPVIEIDSACARLVKAPRSPKQVRHDDVKINLSQKLLLLQQAAACGSSVRADKMLLLLLRRIVNELIGGLVFKRLPLDKVVRDVERCRVGSAIPAKF